MIVKQLETSIIESVKAATEEVCSTMLALNVRPEDSFIMTENNVSADLVASLHFFGDKYMGKIAIFARGSDVCHLAGAMLGAEVKSVDEEAKDCLGEMANMIAGGAKTKLEDTLGLLHLLTPWVIAGKNLTMASCAEDDEGLSLDSQPQVSWLMTKFVFDNGHFTVGIQPNDVPGDATYHLQLHARIDTLQAENKRWHIKIQSVKDRICSILGFGKNGEE